MFLNFQKQGTVFSPFKGSEREPGFGVTLIGDAPLIATELKNVVLNDEQGFFDKTITLPWMLEV